MFSKAFFCRAVKTRDCLGKGLSPCSNYVIIWCIILQSKGAVLGVYKPADKDGDLILTKTAQGLDQQTSGHITQILKGVWVGMLSFILCLFLNPLLHRYSFLRICNRQLLETYGKRRIVCYRQFLLFPQCFLLNQIIVPLFDAELEELKIGQWGKGLNFCPFDCLTLYHTMLHFD